MADQEGGGAFFKLPSELDNQGKRLWEHLRLAVDRVLPLAESIHMSASADTWQKVKGFCVVTHCPVEVKVEDTMPPGVVVVHYAPRPWWKF